MKDKKIIIAGGTGFIGQEMTKHFGKDNKIIILTRQAQHTKNNRNRYDSLSHDDLLNVTFIKWNGETTDPVWAKEFEGADLIINLAGKTVNCRYTEKNKKEIFASRTDAVKAIGTAIAMHPSSEMLDQCFFSNDLSSRPGSSTG